MSAIALAATVLFWLCVLSLGMRGLVHGPRTKQNLLIREFNNVENPRLRTHNQNRTVAVRAIADMKTFGHLS